MSSCVNCRGRLIGVGGCAATIHARGISALRLKRGRICESAAQWTSFSKPLLKILITRRLIARRRSRRRGGRGRGKAGARSGGVTHRYSLQWGRAHVSPETAGDDHYRGAARRRFNGAAACTMACTMERNSRVLLAKFGASSPASFQSPKP
jgi:hypothetical protein